MLEKGQGKCWICGGDEPVGRALAVDHDHRTGKVRGLLCTRCNSGLGFFRDDPTLLTAALKYMEPYWSEDSFLPGD
jgi:hypothetical protein